MTLIPDKDIGELKDAFADARQELKTVQCRTEIAYVKLRKVDELLKIAGLKAGILERDQKLDCEAREELKKA